MNFRLSPTHTWAAIAAWCSGGLLYSSPVDRQPGTFDPAEIRRAKKRNKKQRRSRR